MILNLLFISLAIQIALFFPAYKFKTDKLTDLSYILTFMLLSIMALLRNSATLSKFVLLFMILIWGLRLGVWLAGIITEAFADQQKFNFINNTENKGKWVDIGLWRYSRHPNYLGEILCWIGIYFYTFSSLSFTFRLIGLLSPLTIIALLLFVSGIPKLEEKADKKWGSDKKYQEYKKKTAVLIPFIKVND